MSEVEKLLIHGAGGHGIEVVEMINDLNDFGRMYEILGFIDDDPSLKGQTINGVKVLGPPSVLKGGMDPTWKIVLAFGNPHIRVDQAMRWRPTIGRIPFITLIHPDASVSRDALVVLSAMICADTRIMSGCYIRRHVLINRNCQIGHGVEIGEFSTIHPSVTLSGNVEIGQKCEIGSGAVILPGVSIGNNSKVGAGAVVIESVPPNKTVVGVPARPL